MKKSIKLVLFILGLTIAVSFLTLHSAGTVDAFQDRIIRIALYHDVSSLSSSGSKESLEVSAIKGLSFGYYANGYYTELYSDTSPGRYTVKCSSDDQYGITLLSPSKEVILDFDTRIGHFQARPRPENDPWMIRLGDYYRGFLEFRRYPELGAGYLTCINEVDVEGYLYGVVPKEMEAYSPLEALKAQAVAARTYAYRHLDSPKYPYSSIGANLSDATDCQVYYGYAQVNKITGSLIMVEQPATNRAVDGTRYKTLKYNGSYVYAFYSSSSGGYTEDPRNVWGGGYGYLQANPDRYELTSSSRYFWERTFTSLDLRNIVLAETNNAKDIGPVTRVEIIQRADSGRPTQIMLTGTGGTHIFYNSQCRTAFSLNGQLYDILNAGPLKNTLVLNGYDNIVRSVDPSVLYAVNGQGITVRISKKSVINGADLFRTFENVSYESDSFTFIGRGWGHGVGMSQEGAKGMAQAGYTYRDILSFYYAGTVVE